ncbi:hypothetical protein PRK78_004704 [Emydomyces testavorans]|uniref:AB hydrolase-1 domain-containing protein n=1 Tax=Emydomyces testavorans TaxID=2070801 RepID=A0AAF0DIG4_9EURO|nr:hypothetical protein PRK78_004704 [Emydomyces testavorans]
MEWIPPNYSFAIPSLYDGIQLECRLFHPRAPQHVLGASKLEKKAAVVAHPYVPLGGCFDDPVVGVITHELLKGGYVVGTFNLRGTGKSEGRTSWTAKPELADYISFYGFMIHYMHRLETNAGKEETAQQAGAKDGSSRGGEATVKIILSGYSFGSMLATFLPSAEKVVEVFSSTKPGSSVVKVKQAAIELSEQHNSSLRTRNCQPSTQKPESNGRKEKSLQLSPPSVLYLLVSPILPPVSLLVTMSFVTSQNALSTTADGLRVTGLEPEEALTNHHSLAVYGSRDAFTSAKRLQNWSGKLSSKPGSLFQSVEVQRAGHFWREAETESLMREAIREFI